ncbi:MAG: ABC-F family ATP-binding cassette domain-containing protein [Phycisphaerales bacterium]|nr:ABC-F family ATP-binding cassette domain-containing protein [Phycisphaerales bacterium]
MPTLLSARELTKAYPSNILFENVSMHVENGDRVGLIGPNGAGKSTLLKILAGLQTPDEGEVIRRKGLSLRYVPQDDDFPDDATPLSAVMSGLEPGPDERLDLETRASIALGKLGFTRFDRPVSSLSGGWRKRLSLACALADEPDILLLDEPTNHLDLEGVLWLEGHVRQSTTAMIFVTHDRVFLENTTNRIIELSNAYPEGTFQADGNYSEFLRRKEAFLEAQAAAQSALANKVRRDTAWLEQGIQGRQTRNKTQVRDAAERRADLKAAKGRNEAPTRTTSIDFQATERKTNRLLALTSVAMSMGGKQLFDGLDLVLSPARRIGLLGVNGSGKTTLLRLMNGELQPERGTIKRAVDLRIVTFSQHRETLVATQTLQEALCPVGDTVDYRGKQVHVTGWARRFLFEPDQLATHVGNLSGGEQARVLIANLMLEPADVLLLDEPTNDLDIPSLEVLEEALLEFPGALVLVTHDRFMLQRISDEYVGLDDDGTAKSYASFEHWTRDMNRSKNAADTSKPVADRKPKPRPKNSADRLTWKEQRELESMEERILEAETTVETLQEAAGAPELAADHKRSTEVFTQLSEAQAKVAELYARWAELDARNTRK